MSSEEVELRAAPGWIAPDLAAEFPGLRLDWITVQGRRRRSPPAVARRLAGLSNRVRGSTVVAMRSQPIPRAYRAFYRQIGLDPDVTRIPVEAAAVARLAQGRFGSKDVVEDALLIAVVETGVGVWALDAERVSVGGLGIRASVSGDRLGSSDLASHLQPGRLVVADDEHVHAVLFGEVAREHQVGARTQRIALFTVAVEGVPAIHVEEALWLCTEALAA
jgi:DNA/RNA-binding domain of Phe-tRNA-synthetase-like protein